MIGNYLAAPAVKTWTEDFIDEDTGEIVSIERHEVIFQKGTKIDADLAARIQFCIESGEIEDVEVSNQCRQAVERNLNGLYPWKVRAHIDSKNNSGVFGLCFEFSPEYTKRWAYVKDLIPGKV